SARLRSQVCAGSRFIGVPGDCLTAPVGALIDVRLHNSATLKTDGLDLAGRYELGTRIGRVNLGFESTYILRYAQALAPTAPITNFLSEAHYPPALRARVSSGWERRQFWAATAMNYTGGYEDADSLPHRPVKPWSTWDVALGYQLSESEFFSAAARAHIIVAARNVFNSNPPFLNNA